MGLRTVPGRGRDRSIAVIPGDDEDAILLAGAVRCAWCGREAYPVDATWVTSELVLATFTQPHRTECRGPRAWTIIMDITTDPGQAFMHAPADNARRAREYYRQHSCRACGALAEGRYCDAHRCQGQTLQDRRCTRRAAADGVCGQHSECGRRA
jgi:hypothetical protein